MIFCVGGPGKFSAFFIHRKQQLGPSLGLSSFRATDGCHDARIQQSLFIISLAASWTKN